MADIHHTSEFSFGHGIVFGIRIDAKKHQKTGGETVYNEDKRSHDLHENIDNRCVEKRHLLSMDGCHRLRSNLSEKDDEKRHKPTCDRDGGSTKAVCDCGGKGSYRSINNVVADEDRAKHFT